MFIYLNGHLRTEKVLHTFCIVDLERIITMNDKQQNIIVVFGENHDQYPAGSVGRAVVSKTESGGFKSFFSCIYFFFIFL